MALLGRRIVCGYRVLYTAVRLLCVQQSCCTDSKRVGTFHRQSQCQQPSAIHYLTPRCCLLPCASGSIGTLTTRTPTPRTYTHIHTRVRASSHTAGPIRYYTCFNMKSRNSLISPLINQPRVLFTIRNSSFQCLLLHC